MNKQEALRQIDYLAENFSGEQLRHELNKLVNSLSVEVAGNIRLILSLISVKSFSVR